MVDVILDPGDDLATIGAIRELAAREPSLLAVMIAPDSRSSPAVVWAILRALGKRVEQLARTPVKVWWDDAARWLVAHRIAEVVVLCAQHLRGGTAEELKLHVGRRLGIALAFVYGGRVQRCPTTTLCAFLARPRSPAPARGLARSWPRVPRSHPLRLRYDCAQRLSTGEFERVDRLLLGSLRTLGGWRWSMGYPTRGELTRAVRVVSAADDPEQAYIRRCGAELALIGDGIAIPQTRPLRPRARPVTSAQIDAMLAYTDPAAAGYLLAKLVTGLVDEMLELIAGDQITDEAILGCPVPERARPILRALDDHHEPVLRRPGGPVVQPVGDARAAHAAPTEEALATALGWLLHERDAHIPRSETPAVIRPRLEQLRGDGILEFQHGAYRASEIAFYSSYHSPSPPPVLSLTNEWDDSLTSIGNPADI